MIETGWETVTNRPLTRIGTAFLAVAVLWGIGFCAIGPHYWTMDDVQMSREAAGRVITDEPEARLQFTHVWIGRLLVGLHESLPGTAWYGVYLLTVHFLAQTTLLYAMLLRSPGRGHLLLFVGWFGTIGLTFLNRLQFTMTAFMAGMAGGLLILATLDSSNGDEESNDSPKWRWLSVAQIVWGAGLVLLCSMIRWRVLFMVTGLLVPLGLWTFLRASGRGRMTLLACSVAILAVCTGARIHDRSVAARGADWLREDDERLLTNEFIDYHAVPYTPDTKPIFDDVGWSENDFAALMWGWWSDKTVFSADSLERVLEHSRTNWCRFSPLQWVVAALLQSREFPVLVVAGLLTLIVTFRPDVPPERRWVVAGSVLLAIAAWIYLAATKQRVPPWVVVPLGAGPLFVAIAVGGPTRRTSGHVERTWYRIVLVTCVLAAAWWGWRERAYHLDRERFEALIAEDWRQLEPRPGELFLYAVGSQWFPPVLDPAAEPETLAIVFVAAPQRTEASLRQRVRHGIDSDLVTALLERDDVYLVCEPRLQLANVEARDLPPLPEVLRRYAREHHGVETRFVRRHLGPTLVAMRVDRVPRPDSTSKDGGVEQVLHIVPAERTKLPDPPIDHSTPGVGTTGAGGADGSSS